MFFSLELAELDYCGFMDLPPEVILGNVAFFPLYGHYVTQMPLKAVVPGFRFFFFVCVIVEAKNVAAFSRFVMQI